MGGSKGKRQTSPLYLDLVSELYWGNIQSHSTDIFELLGNVKL